MRAGRALRKADTRARPRVRLLPRQACAAAPAARAEFSRPVAPKPPKLPQKEQLDDVVDELQYQLKQPVDKRDDEVAREYLQNVNKYFAEYLALAPKEQLEIAELREEVAERQAEAAEALREEASAVLARLKSARRSPGPRHSSP